MEGVIAGNLGIIGGTSRELFFFSFLNIAIVLVCSLQFVVCGFITLTEEENCFYRFVVILQCRRKSVWIIFYVSFLFCDVSFSFEV